MILISSVHDFVDTHFPNMDPKAQMQEKPKLAPKKWLRSEKKGEKSYVFFSQQWNSQPLGFLPSFS